MQQVLPVQTGLYRYDQWCRNGGEAAPLPICQEGQGGQNCPFHFSAIVTKQTLANLKAQLSNAEYIQLFMNNRSKVV